ncbi:hypothetical protein FYJ28_16785 [Arthrobacter sp. BL-252-APC-1A]|nr:hypothetical protein [Arthrobacter sp. BL-252-APC-1A]
MIPNVVRGERMSGLMMYLVGSGKTNEHTSPGNCARLPEKRATPIPSTCGRAPAGGARPGVRQRTSSPGCPGRNTPCSSQSHA